MIIAMTKANLSENNIIRIWKLMRLKVFIQLLNFDYKKIKSIVKHMSFDKIKTFKYFLLNRINLIPEMRKCKED